MPHLVPLLIRGINNLSDARYCAGMGADKLTFVLDPAIPGHLDARTVKELAGWIAGVELVGEFDQLSAHEINGIAADCGLDAVLLRSYRSAAELAEIAPPVYLELAPESTAAHTAEQPAAWPWASATGLVLPAQAAGWVLEITANASSQTVARLQDLAQAGPLWLGPGLLPDYARQLVNQLPLAGLVLPSGNEVKPGLRDFDQLEAVFEALEID